LTQSLGTFVDAKFGMIVVVVAGGQPTSFSVALALVKTPNHDIRSL